LLSPYHYNLIVAQNIELPKCPFDKKPCKYVSSCDDVLSLRCGFDVVEGDSCPRAVKSVRKK
jgi:hypothetical protein